MKKFFACAVALMLGICLFSSMTYATDSDEEYFKGVDVTYSGEFGTYTVDASTLVRIYNLFPELHSKVIGLYETACKQNNVPVGNAICNMDYSEGGARLKITTNEQTHLSTAVITYQKHKITISNFEAGEVPMFLGYVG